MPIAVKFNFIFQNSMSAPDQSSVTNNRSGTSPLGSTEKARMKEIKWGLLIETWNFLGQIFSN